VAADQGETPVNNSIERSSGRLTTGTNPGSSSHAETAVAAKGAPAIERFVHREGQASLMAAEHFARYLLASQLVAGSKVLDAGCGTGYGSEMFSAAGASVVVGVDLSDTGLSEEHRHQASYVQGDLARLPFCDGAFDKVVCFEVIEHVSDADAVLDELKRVLDKDGLLIVSSPNRCVNVPGNPFHVHEFTPDELSEALASRFSHVEFLQQHPFVGSHIGASIAGDASAIPGLRNLPSGRLASLVSFEPGAEQYMIAVAGDMSLPTPQGETVLGDTMDLRWWTERLTQADEGVRTIELLGADKRYLAEQVKILGDRLVVAEQANARLLVQSDRIDELEHDYSESQQHLSDARQRLAQSAELVEELQRWLTEAVQQVTETEQRLVELQTRLDRILATRLMRLVKLARRVYGRIRRLAGGRR